MGPSTVPCGTPEVTGTDVEVSPSSTTAWVLLLEKVSYPSMCEGVSSIPLKLNSTQMVNRSTSRYLALNISDNMQQMLFPGNTVDLYYYLYRVGDLITRSCLLRSSVSISVSVWVIWRITNRQTFRSMPILNLAYHTKSWYDELQIGRFLKVCQFLIRHNFTAWYAELRIGILLKVCRFLIRHTLPNADL